MYTIDHELLKKIDKLDLSQRNQDWRAAMKAAGWRVYVDRERWTVKSWQETEGEDIQMRYAKLLKAVLDNIEIKIHDLTRSWAGPPPVSSDARPPSTSVATTSTISGTMTA